MSHITASTDEDVLFIKIEPASLNDGDLSNDVKIEIEEAFQRFKTKNAVVDLQNLKTLDSVGLRIFVRMLKKSRKHSGRVILCNATGVVADVLSLSRIVTADASLVLVPDREDAIAALSSNKNL